MSTATHYTRNAVDSINIYDPHCLDFEQQSFRFRPVLFWKVANRIATRLALLTAGPSPVVSYMSRTKGFEGEDLQEAVEGAMTLCGILRTHIGRLKTHAQGLPPTDPIYVHYVELEKIFISVAMMTRREFDDASFAFYAVCDQGFETLDEGYDFVRAQYNYTVENAPLAARTEEEEADTQSADLGLTQTAKFDDNNPDPFGKDNQTEHQPGDDEPVATKPKKR